jgi:hypothetical protein
MLSTQLLDWSRGRALLGLACAAALLVSGCGDGRVRVRGTVVFEGKPLEEGFVSLEPVDGVGPTTGGAITGGKYDLTGEARATVGEKLVRIIGSRKTGRKIPAGNPPGAMADEWVQCIPKQYNDESTLKVTITPGRDNTHNFDLPIPKSP